MSHVALRPGDADGALAIPPSHSRSCATNAEDRRSAIADLRRRIRDLERSHGKVPRLDAPRRETEAPAPEEMEGEPTAAAFPAVAGVSSSVPAVSSTLVPVTTALAWTLGDSGLDEHLPGRGLATAALHEVKPATARDWPTALAFALRLAARRLAGLPATPEPSPLILWCATTAFTAEHGRLHPPGIDCLGISHRSLLVVETARETETLWALEEGLRSSVPALVIGALSEARLTPARRLSLAAATFGVPCLILTAPRTGAAPAAETRWRLARLPSASHAFDPQAPGAPRLRLDLERCRGLSSASAFQSTVVEWCDVTHRFRMAAVLAHRPAAPDLAPARTLWAADSAG